MRETRRPTMTVSAAIEALKSFVGTEVKVTGWTEVTQERVNGFAEATGDHRYIHVDPERARETFFGGTVAHGYLTLSMMYGSADDAEEEVEGIDIELGSTLIVNDGLDKVRFPAPVPVGSRVRQRVTLTGVEAIGEQAIQLRHVRTVEVDGADKPTCVAETLIRYYF